MQSSWGGAGVSRRRGRSHGAVVSHGSRGVSLGADNDAACRTLDAHDPPDTDDELAALEALTL